LADFLRGRSVACPLCGYDLRDLTGATCPECRHELHLAVDVRGLRFGWFLAALTPSLFAGLAAACMAVLLLANRLTSGGEPPPVVHLLIGLGFAGGVAGLVLVGRRHAFLRRRPATQRAWALAAWGLHAVPFAGLVLLVILTA